jgi:hypothetical protein
MKIKRVLPALVAVLAVVLLVSCMSAPANNSVYQSSAPELRGERAISSNIELIAEVDLETSVLGVFYSREVYQSGDAQTLLFTRRAKVGFGDTKKPGSVVDYDLSETSSLSVEQGRKLLSAIEEYLAKDPKSLTPAQMFNFELYSGTVDMSAGSDRYRPFKNVTFIVVCSVTNAAKSFKTVFPGIMVGMYGTQQTVYETFDLKEPQVKSMHDAIKAAVDKAPLAPAVAPSKGGA